MKVINMILTKRHIANESAKMFADSIRIATSLRNWRKHDVTVVLSEWSDYLFGHMIFSNQWLSATVDDERVLCGKLGIGNQSVIHKCTIFSLSEEGQNV